MKQRTEEYKRMSLPLTSRLTGYMEEWETLLDQIEQIDDWEEECEARPEVYQRFDQLSLLIATSVCADYQVHKIRLERSQEPTEGIEATPTTDPAEEQLDWVEVHDG